MNAEKIKRINEIFLKKIFRRFKQTINPFNPELLIESSTIRICICIAGDEELAAH